MKFVKSLAIFGTLAVLAFGSTAKAEDTYDAIIKRGTIRIASDPGQPPFGMLNAQLVREGSDVEIAKLLAKDWNLKLEWVDVTGPSRIPTLLADKADIVISGLSVTEERKQVIDFTAPYARTRSMLGGSKDIQLKSIDDLRGKVVALTRGSNYDSALTPLAAEKGFTIQRYDDEATTITAAVSGQAKVTAFGESLNAQVIKRNPNFENKFALSSSDMAMAIRKDNPVLKAKLGEWIAANIKNGKIAGFWKQYHGFDLPAEFGGPK